MVELLYLQSQMLRLLASCKLKLYQNPEPAADIVNAEAARASTTGSSLCTTLLTCKLPYMVGLLYLQSQMLRLLAPCKKLKLHQNRKPAADIVNAEAARASTTGSSL